MRHCEEPDGLFRSMTKLINLFISGFLLIQQRLSEHSMRCISLPVLLSEHTLRRLRLPLRGLSVGRMIPGLCFCMPGRMRKNS